MSILFTLLLSACGHYSKPAPSLSAPYLAPGSESTYGQCGGEYDLDLSAQRVDVTRFVSADYDSGMRGRLILDPEGSGEFVGCLLSRDDECQAPDVTHTYESGLEVCVHMQRCCRLVR